MFDPAFPLIDLHRHLDGNVRLETILDLGEKFNLPLPARDVDGLRPHIQVTEPQPGVMNFISRFHWMIAVLQDYESCRRIAYENVKDARREGLDYVELRFSPMFMASANRLDPAGVVEAVCDGVKFGQRDFKLPVNLIGILSRTYGPEMAWKELNALITQKDRLVALDLAGDEANFPGELFVQHMRTGREMGWQIIAHAGEIAGPQSIRQAMQELGAVRIGHAVAAVQDIALLQLMKDQHVGIECNLTSNFQTSTVPDYPSHPIKEFLNFGLLATINTDDPGISGIDLAYEYQIAAPAAGLSAEQIFQAQRNALEISFLSDESKADLIRHKAQF